MKVLRKTIKVAPTGATDGTPLKTLVCGTPESEIPDAERAQLCDDHFEERAY